MLSVIGTNIESRDYHKDDFHACSPPRAARDPKFFLGTDSAPHAVLLKEHGRVTLSRQSWTVPERYPFGQADLKPLRAGEALGWRMV